MKAYLSQEADAELVKELVFYMQEGGAEIANAFLAEFEKVAAFLCKNPELGALWRNNRRRFSLRKFPFHVIYYVRGDELRIVAIAHHRRMPGYWGGRK